MPGDEIKTRLTVDAKEGIDELKRFGQAEKGVVDGVTDAGKATARTSEHLREHQGVVGGLSNKVGGLAAQYASIPVILAAVVAALKAVTGAAQEAVEKMAELGGGIEGLAANIGGKRADETVAGINQIAASRGLGVKGRGELINFASTLTDLQPGVSQEQLRSQLEAGGSLLAASSIGGAETARLSVTFQNRFGLNEQDAANQLATLLNSGLEPQTIGELSERGGEELLALALAGRGFGDVNKGGRELVGLLDRLNERDEKGQLVGPLKSLGITDQTSTLDRIRTVANARREGKLSEGQLFKLLGGTKGVAKFDQFAQAESQGLVGEAAQQLLEGTAEDEIQKKRQSELVALAIRERERKLRVQRAGEEATGLTGVGELMSEYRTQTAEMGAGSELLGHLMEFNILPMAYQGIVGGSRGNWQQGPGGSLSITHNHVANNYGGFDPYVEDSGRRR